MVLGVENWAKPVALLEDGRSFKHLARIHDHRSTIKRVFERCKQTGENGRNVGDCRKRKTTTIADGFLHVTTRQDRHLTSDGSRNQLQEI